MKKRLITGLGLVLFIFTIGAVVVIKSLDNIVINQKLIHEQDIIIGKYNEMLFQMKGAQAELYRHQAGYTRNIDGLVSYVEAFSENMIFLSKQYSGHLHDVACMQCHSKIEERLTSLDQIFSGLKELKGEYEKDVSILITTNDENQRKLLETSTTERGNNIILLLEKVKHAADKMRGEIKNNRNTLIDRSKIAIFSALLLIIGLSSVIFIVIIRGITIPINSLIRGIQTIASGDFSRRVEIRTKDEIGFMAQAFNNMAEKLSSINEEKDKLLNTLKDFNEELEKKVAGATDALRLAHENMVRTETLAAIGTLAAGVSHEISTPLNTIIGFTQLLISGLAEGSQERADMTVIEQEAMRTKKIVLGLLNFARAGGHEEKTICLNDTVSETLALIEYQPSMKKITVKKELQDDLIFINADPLQLKQVFLNIILNAIQAMPEGGELGVKTGNTTDGVEIAISDTGPGISKEEQQKIFQPFYTTKRDGTGLGLSISYGIVKEHGGEIFVESSSGKGTVFRILLPSNIIMPTGDYAGV